MKVKYFADRDRNKVIKHLDEVGDVDIINIVESNNRVVVYYKDREVKKPSRAKLVKNEPKQKDIENG